MSNFIKNLNKLIKKVENNGNPNIVRFETGETEIRLVDNPYAPDDLFILVDILYRSGGVVNETSFSPKTFGQSDPIDDLVNAKLSKGTVPKAEYAKLMSMKSSQSALVPCVVRGKEKEGVKWANFSKPQFKEIGDRIQRAYKTDRKNFSVTDPESAYDIYVSITQKSKNEPRKYSFDIARGKTPLTEDPELLEQLTDDDAVMNWEELFPKLTTDDVLTKLRTSIEMGKMGNTDTQSDDSNDAPTSPDQYKESLKSKRQYSYEETEDDDSVEEDAEVSDNEKQMQKAYEELRKKFQNKENNVEVEDDDMPF